MIGNVKEDGRVFIYSAFTTPVTTEEWRIILYDLFGVEDGTKIFEQYPIGPPISNSSDTRNTMCIAATDAFFRCTNFNISYDMTMIANSKNAIRQSPVYYYHFNHVWSFSAAGWGSGYNPGCAGHVCHGSEIPFIFKPNLSFINSNYTADEEQLILIMQQYWTTFGK